MVKPMALDPLLYKYAAEIAQARVIERKIDEIEDIENPEGAARHRELALQQIDLLEPPLPEAIAIKDPARIRAIIDGLPRTFERIELQVYLNENWPEEEADSNLTTDRSLLPRKPR